MHRPGAGGEIGFAAIANAPARSAQLGGPQRFELLGNVIDDPSNFAVHADSPLRNLKDLAEHARANPGKVTVGSTGISRNLRFLSPAEFEREIKEAEVGFRQLWKELPTSNA